MAMKDDAKSLSFVEDTAVAPERLRDYIERFLAIVQRHGTTAGVYAHASVGCLHVRPVVNMKTEEGVRRFEAIANDVSDLVLEFGGALSGEHGDGLVRSPFMEKMFGPVLYDAFRTIKRTFDPNGIFNPGKIVDAPPLTANLRFGPTYVHASVPTYFDYPEGSFAGAVEMCSGLGACRKTLEGTMCPSYMATRDEQHATRGRANVLRLTIAGRLGEAGLGDRGVYETLDLCLECRACKAECPVGVDVARFKSEFLADYWQRHGTPLHARALGQARRAAEWGSRLAPLSNWIVNSGLGRRLNERVLGIDRRRRLPAVQAPTLTLSRKARLDGDRAPNRSVRRPMTCCSSTTPSPTTTTPRSAWPRSTSCPAAGLRPALARKPLLRTAADLEGPARRPRATWRRATPTCSSPTPTPAGRCVFCEPSCLSAVREDAPALLRGEARRQSRSRRQKRSVLFEEFVAARMLNAPSEGRARRPSCSTATVTRSRWRWSRRRKPCSSAHPGHDGRRSRRRLLRHGRLVRLRPRALRRLARDRRTQAVPRRAPANRTGAVVVAAGTSCRHQIADFTGESAVHPAVLIAGLLEKDADDEVSPGLSLGALVVAMIVSCFSQLNVGVLGLALAWILGVYLGGMSLNEVMNGFPVADCS